MTIEDNPLRLVCDGCGREHIAPLNVKTEDELFTYACMTGWYMGMEDGHHKCPNCDLGKLEQMSVRELQTEIAYLTQGGTHGMRKCELRKLKTLERMLDYKCHEEKTRTY